MHKFIADLNAWPGLPPLGSYDQQGSTIGGKYCEFEHFSFYWLLARPTKWRWKLWLKLGHGNRIDEKTVIRWFYAQRLNTSRLEPSHKKIIIKDTISKTSISKWKFLTDQEGKLYKNVKSRASKIYIIFSWTGFEQILGNPDLPTCGRLCRVGK